MRVRNTVIAAAAATTISAVTAVWIHKAPLQDILFRPQAAQVEDNSVAAKTRTLLSSVGARPKIAREIESQLKAIAAQPHGQEILPGVLENALNLKEPGNVIVYLRVTKDLLVAYNLNTRLEDRKIELRKKIMADGTPRAEIDRLYEETLRIDKRQEGLAGQVQKLRAQIRDLLFPQLKVLTQVNVAIFLSLMVGALIYGGVLLKRTRDVFMQRDGDEGQDQN